MTTRKKLHKTVHSAVCGTALTMAACGMSACQSITNRAAADMPSIHIHTNELPSLPNTPGVAGPYVGVHNDALILAGGANFPTAPPWDGGKKVWHDTIYVLTKPHGTWQNAGRLRETRAYGVSITTDRGVLCLGGNNAEQTTNQTFYLTWRDGQILQKPFVPLPTAMASFGGAQIGSRIYIAGGQAQSNPMATPSLSTFLMIDLDADEPTWTALPTWPGPERFFPVVATDGQSFYIFSGFQRIAKLGESPKLEYLKDAYRYDPASNRWTRLADLPHPNAAAPSPAPMHNNQILLLGNGADGTGLELPLKDRPSLGRDILSYDINADQWCVVGQLPYGVVTTPAVKWQHAIVLASGEPKAGMRTPRTLSLEITSDAKEQRAHDAP